MISKQQIAAGVAALAWLALAAPAVAVAESEPGADAKAAMESEGAQAPMPSEAAPDAEEGFVARSAFTRAVVDREPQDDLTAMSNDETQVDYFTEIRDMEGQTVTHRWEWNGQVMAEVPFEIGGPRWRVYSSKSLDPSWLGTWTVSVVDSQGRVLSRQQLSYTEGVIGAAPAQKPDAEAPVPAAPAEP